MTDEHEPLMRADDFGEARPVDCHGEAAEFKVAKLELERSAARCQPSLALGAAVAGTRLRRVLWLIEAGFPIRLGRFAVGFIGRRGGSLVAWLRRDDALLPLDCRSGRAVRFA